MKSNAKKLIDALERGEHIVAFDHWVTPGLTPASKYGVGALSQTITRDVKPFYGDRLVSERVPGKRYHQYFLTSI